MSDFLGLFIFNIPKMANQILTTIKYLYDYQFVVMVILPE